MAINHLAKSKMYQKHIETNSDIDAESHFYAEELYKLVGKEQVACIRKALGMLSADERLALSLNYLNERLNNIFR